MVQTANENLRTVKEFKKKLARKWRLTKVVFFGSRAKGVFREDSDFDLLLVSKDFDEIPFYERAKQVYLEWRKHYPLEVFCYTPREVEDKVRQRYNIVCEALETGVVV